MYTKNHPPSKSLYSVWGLVLSVIALVALCIIRIAGLAKSDIPVDLAMIGNRGYISSIMQRFYFGVLAYMRAFNFTTVERILF